MEDSCVGCNAGTHKALWGTTGCIKCDAPKYSQNASILCSACPRGKMWIRRGAEETACAICEAGKYAYNSAGSTVCTDCPAGSYQPSNESHTCTSCPAGKAGTVTNATHEAVACTIHCTPGHYSEANPYSSSNPASSIFPTVCTDCPAATYSNTFLAGSCTSCPANSWSAAGSTNLSNCSCTGYIFSGSTICIVEIATASLTHFLLAGGTQGQMESLALPATLVNSRPFTDPRRA